VPYSPEFNGIECFFSLVKNEYKKDLLEVVMSDGEVD
jgi:transposase